MSTPVGEPVIPVGDGGTDPMMVRDEVRHLLTTRYDLGEVTEVWPISGGYINWSFGARAVSGDGESLYFVRKYNRGTDGDAVRYEHALIDQLVHRGFDKVAPVLRTGDEASFVTLRDANDPHIDRYFAVYGFLPGETKYSWCFDTDVTETELVNCARTLAEYHAAVSDYAPGRDRRPTPGAYQGNGTLPPIMEHLPILPPIYEALATGAEQNVFGRYLRSKIDTVLRCVRDATLHGRRLEGMPALVVHSDFHAGNMKYQDGEVVALFDFDFARFDYRMFDIGHALHFFCFSWAPEDDGQLWAEKMVRFVREYQAAIREYPGVGPMRPAELANLIPFLHAGNIFTLDWDIRDYFAEPGRDPDEYLTYLQHNVRLMETIDAKQDEISRLVAAAAK